MATLITIVYDNRLHDKTLESGWGFSCYIEHKDKKILFDTGDKPNPLLSNLESLKIKPENIDFLVLSHNHWDHTGGIEAVLKKNSSVILYFGDSFPQDFREKLSKKNIKFLPVDKILEIGEGIRVGPEMGIFGPKEIPLTVETKDGLIVITGCAHPGIVKMVKKVRKKLAKEIYLVLGGFHLEHLFKVKRITSDLKKLGVKKVAPCHCTGDRAIKIFQEEYKENFIEIGAGLKIKLL